GFHQWRKQKEEKVISALYDYEKNYLEPFRKKEKKLEDISVGLEAWSSAEWSHPASAVYVVEVAQALRKQGKNAEALSLVEKSTSHLSAKTYPEQLVYYLQGVLYEESQKYTQALAL